MAISVLWFSRCPAVRAVTKSIASSVFRVQSIVQAFPAVSIGLGNVAAAACNFFSLVCFEIDLSSAGQMIQIQQAPLMQKWLWKPLADL